MKQLPIRQQFVQTPLLLWKRSGDQVHRANRKNASLVLKVSMEMSKVMRRARFGEHSDDNAKEAA